MRLRHGQRQVRREHRAATSVYEQALAAPAWDEPPMWVHGDPAPGNLLCSDGRLSAVIDFGTLAVGDPAVDLALPRGTADLPHRHARGRRDLGPWQGVGTDR
ncbi:phosphotransferase [Kutzneria viridogrisea]|uniref:phosphotransferase n=1 Tax=Kutzneria viridogrisea TaxID=47990 RepID=UPI00046CF327